jgi:hypothetical protein
MEVGNGRNQYFGECQFFMLLKTFIVIAQPGSNKERTGERAFWMA